MIRRVEVLFPERRIPNLEIPICDNNERRAVNCFDVHTNLRMNKLNELMNE